MSEGAKEDPQTGRITGGTMAERDMVAYLRQVRIDHENAEALAEAFPTLSEPVQRAIARLMYLSSR